MEHTIATSADGSSTLKLNEFDECYHSSNGAYNEAMHIYIRNGVEAVYNELICGKFVCNNSWGSFNKEMQITVYDVGLGTALNCILTLLWQQSLVNPPHIRYIGIEKYPIDCEEAAKLNYPNYIANCISSNEINEEYTTQKDVGEVTATKSEEIKVLFNKIHSAPWEEDIEIAANFILHKSCADIVTYEPKESTNTTTFEPNESANICNISNSIYCKSVIFYDTFSPATQPHLWDKEIFKRLYNSIESKSILVTYCSKGTVKEALREAGFTVKRLSGPAGKRHIVQASKL